MHDKIPVIVYHSVGPRVPKNRIYYGLRTPVRIFESHLKYLKKHQFSTISLDEYYNRSDLPKNPIVITFDDGYLDNWVYAYPLLKKYGFKSTIFVSTDFVDPVREVRPNLFDVWDGKITDKDLLDRGFLSWEEMQIMEKSGLVDIQSHAKTHAWYFTGEKIVDFLYPNSIYEKGYEWIFWNIYPDLKPFYLNDNLDKYEEYGTPIYQYGKSLQNKRYYPDKKIDCKLREFIKCSGGTSFFKNPNWRSILFEKTKEFANKKNGYYESDSEYYHRVYDELKDSKEIIERNLNKKIDFLCWPGGSRNEKNLEIADKLGYKATTGTPNDKRKNFIDRITSCSLTIKKDDKIYDTLFLDGRFLIFNLKAYKGSLSSKLIYVAMVYSRLLWHKLSQQKKDYYYIRY